MPAAIASPSNSGVAFWLAATCTKSPTWSLEIT